MEQMILFPPTSEWVPPTSLPELRGRGLVALDIEGKDEGLGARRAPAWPMGQGWISGISYAQRRGTEIASGYVPIRHPDSPECFEIGAVYQWLRDLLLSGTPVVFHNCWFDLGWFIAEGIVTPQELRGLPLNDTMAAMVLLDENADSYSLDTLTAQLGIPGKNTAKLVEAALTYGLIKPSKAKDAAKSQVKQARAQVWKLPARFVGEYGQDDAVATLLSAEQLLPRLREQGLEYAFRLEMDLVPCVLAMRQRGMRVNLDRATLVQAQFRQMRQDAFEDLRTRLASTARAEEIVDLTRNMESDERYGMRDMRSGKRLAALFDTVGVDYANKGRLDGRGRPLTPSFKRQDLEMNPHWLPQLVVRLRRLDDMAEKFIGKYILDHSHMGRVHAEIHQLRDDEGGTRSFRFSYSDPPLQQMPARDAELAPLVRGIFEPEDGEDVLSADYSQQEPRLTVHYAYIMKLAGGDRAHEYYCTDPNPDYHTMVAKMTGQPRKVAKILNLGLAYGMGVAKLAVGLGSSVEDAQIVLDQYHAEVPFVRGLTEACANRAQQVGFVRLLDGRRCRFDEWEVRWYDRERARDEPYQRRLPCSHDEAMRRVNDPEHSWYRQRVRRAYTHKAMNRLIQGGSAVQTKEAMRDAWNAGMLPWVQMHDELGFSCPDSTFARRARQLMVEAWPRIPGLPAMSVPVKVDAALGENWGVASDEKKAKSIDDWYQIAA